jgi:hypothetical protein
MRVSWLSWCFPGSVEDISRSHSASIVEWASWANACAYVLRWITDAVDVHSQTPVDYESVLALLVLSVYEYSQRGNLLKMRYLDC